MAKFKLRIAEIDRLCAELKEHRQMNHGKNFIASIVAEGELIEEEKGIPAPITKIGNQAHISLPKPHIEKLDMKRYAEHSKLAETVNKIIDYLNTHPTI